MIVYQITAGDTRAYASDIAACDALCAIMIDNGVLPKVRRIKKSSVPLCDLEMINEL